MVYTIRNYSGNPIFAWPLTIKPTTYASHFEGESL
jgi:hypothetical protein